MKYIACQSSRLGDRSNNQDRCAIIRKNNTILLLLADGMGGRKGGELAAQKFIDVMTVRFNHAQWPLKNATEFLHSSILEAHREIRKLGNAQIKAPCTTCVCCIVHEQLAIWAHSGDSRLYHIRDGEILFRTRDHSYVADLIKCDAITEKEASSHPMRNYVTSCLGGSDKHPAIILQPAVTLRPHDLIILCSDGLWSATSCTQLNQLSKAKDILKHIERLTENATRHRYPNCDNVSAVVFKLIASNTNAETSTLPVNSLQNTPTIPSDLDQAIVDIQSAYSRYEKELNSKK